MSEYPWNKKNITFTWLNSPYNPFKLAAFWQWAKGSREAASEGPTVLDIHFPAYMAIPSSTYEHQSRHDNSITCMAVQ